MKNTIEYVKLYVILALFRNSLLIINIIMSGSSISNLFQYAVLEPNANSLGNGYDGNVEFPEINNIYHKQWWRKLLKL